MNRFSSTLAVFSMLMLADVIILKQTLSTDGFSLFAAAQIVFGIVLIGSALVLINRRYSIGLGIASRSLSGVAHPLRRLLASVWS